MAVKVELSWDERGLLPAVVQDAETGALLMLAWMNQEALRHTLESGFAHFYSRSRSELWKKGETSGNTLSVKEVRYDCDQDAILVLAAPNGPTCHTGASSCFYRRLDAEVRDDGPAGVASGVLARLERELVDRRENASAGSSYTKSLLDAGFPKILAKIAEEQQELADELPAGPRDKVVHEAADLLYHVMVGMVARKIPMSEVWRQLNSRFGVSGHVEKASRSR